MSVAIAMLSPAKYTVKHYNDKDPRIIETQFKKKEILYGEPEIVNSSSIGLDLCMGNVWSAEKCSGFPQNIQANVKLVLQTEGQQP